MIFPLFIFYSPNLYFLIFQITDQLGILSKHSNQLSTLFNEKKQSKRAEQATIFLFFREMPNFEKLSFSFLAKKP